MKQPSLRSIPLSAVNFDEPILVITMSHGQWDALLATMYDKGAILLEIGPDEVPVRAYQRESNAPQ